MIHSKYIVIGLMGLMAFLSHCIAAEPPHAPNQEKFRFFINADPQMGPKETKVKTLLLLNDLLEDFSNEVNIKNEKEKVDFVVYNGDLVWDPYQDAFDNFTRLVSIQKPPVVLVHGNHDGHYPDNKFLKAQKELSGYQKLNYSFEYGNWHFVILAAQEMYLNDERKQEQLNWVRNELLKFKDKQVMLFMHYHILPIGLSQMESYTYWPTSFKNELLNLITEHGNVKYVFNGHVHAGVKASIKSSLEYKGAKFINVPTPVMARPFGEEFDGFDEDGRYKQHGFYMEVQVDGDDIEMIGHKIKNKYSHQYPKTFTQFKPEMDIRAFTPEADLEFNSKLKNGSFNQGFEGWQKSYRYLRDNVPMFYNQVIDGGNHLSQVSGYGAWNLDEYMESWQTFEFDASKPNYLQYKFETPKVDKRGAGGYIRVFSYSESGDLLFMLLLHWGHQEERVKYMYRAWATNVSGKRYNAFWLNKAIKKNKMAAFNLPVKEGEKQQVEIDLNKIFSNLHKNRSGSIELSDISHIGLAHGVWTRVTHKGLPITSQLIVDEITLDHSKVEGRPLIMFNGEKIQFSEREKEVPYAESYRKKVQKNLQKK